MVTWQAVNPSFELELPNFSDIQRKTITPIIDDRSFSFGPIKEGNNLYDDLIENLKVKDTSIKGDTSIKTDTTTQNSLNASILKHLGESYSLARRTQNGYSDCSSFVGKVLKDAGINIFNGLPTAATMYQSNKLQTVSKAQPGDLIFFSGTDRRGGITHIGIITEVDNNGNPTKMAHASSRQYGKTVIVDYNSNYWNKFKPKVKRIMA